MFMWPCIVTNFFLIKPTRCTNFTNLFWHETLHVLDSSSVHHQEFIHHTLSNGICHTGLQPAFKQDLVLLVGFIKKEKNITCISHFNIYFKPYILNLITILYLWIGSLSFCNIPLVRSIPEDGHKCG